MGRLLKFLVYLFLLLAIGILAYSYVGDMSAPQHDVSLPLEAQ